MYIHTTRTYVVVVSMQYVDCDNDLDDDWSPFITKIISRDHRWNPLEHRTCRPVS